MIPWERGVWLAKTRAIVQLPDGRTARVLSWPIPARLRRNPARRHGQTARVQLSSGAILSVRPDQVTELKASCAAGSGSTVEERAMPANPHPAGIART